MKAGQQFYLLSLAEPLLLTNFAISARPTDGTVTLYAGDETAIPGAKSWSVLARNVSIGSINEKKLANPFNRLAKYVLVETNVTEPGPLFSLYLYGDRPAVSYQLRKRDARIDTKAIFSQHVNTAATCDLAALYTHAQVSYANAPEGFVSWQKLIDENAESGINVLPAADAAGVALKLESSHRLSRFAVLTGGAAKGSLDFYVVPNLPTESGASAQTATIATATNAPSLAGLTPTATVALDGSAERGSIDFPPVEGQAVLVRWTPATAGEALALRELNAFGECALDEYEVALAPDAIAELADEGRYTAAFKDYKDFKGLPPVGEFISPRTPPIPGALGFPPNLTRRNPVSP
jgi:hypothetical protein